MGVALGTPTYMAPEQASADPAMDHRVDVYAFGVMAYEMLAGQPPFTGRTPQALLGAHLVAVPDPVTLHRPGLPPALASLVMQCLEKHPADRPQTAGILISTLDSMTTPERRDDPGAGTHGRRAPAGGGRQGSGAAFPADRGRTGRRGGGGVVGLVVAGGRDRGRPSRRRPQP